MYNDIKKSFPMFWGREGTSNSPDDIYTAYLNSDEVFRFASQKFREFVPPVVANSAAADAAYNRVDGIFDPKTDDAQDLGFSDMPQVLFESEMRYWCEIAYRLQQNAYLKPSPTPDEWYSNIGSDPTPMLVIPRFQEGGKCPCWC